VRGTDRRYLRFVALFRPVALRPAVFRFAPLVLRLRFVVAPRRSSPSPPRPAFAVRFTFFRPFCESERPALSCSSSNFPLAIPRALRLSPRGEMRSRFPDPRFPDPRFALVAPFRALFFLVAMCPHRLRRRRAMIATLKQ
jgi:hypothetical protein